LRWDESIFRAVPARSFRDRQLYRGARDHGSGGGDDRPTDPTRHQSPAARAEEEGRDKETEPVVAVAGMAGSMQAADAAGRLSALLSLLALRRLLAVLQPLALLLLLPFRWRSRPGAGAGAAAVASDAAPGASGKKGKAASSSSVVLRVPAGSPMVAARRQASARREVAMRRAREAGREYELIPTARGETLFTQCWWPRPSSTVKPR
jgi:hypothetical protein